MSAYEDPEQRGEILQAAPLPAVLVFLVLFAAFLAAVFFVALKRVNVSVQGRGSVQPASAERIVRAPRSGVVSRVHTTRGSAVRPGAPLLSFDDRALQIRMRHAEAGLKTQVELLRKLEEAERTRAPTVTRGGVASRAAPSSTPAPAVAALEEHLLRLAGQQERVRAHRQTVELLQLQQKRLTVHAPVIGRVTRLLVAQGDAVRAGEPLAIVNPSDAALVGRIRMETKHRRVLKVGQRVRLLLDEYPVADYGAALGRVRRIESRSVPPAAGGRGEGAPGSEYLSLEIELVRMPPRTLTRFRKGMTFTAEIVHTRQRLAAIIFPRLSNTGGR